MMHVVVVAAMVSFITACTKQTTTQTVELHFGKLSCSVATTTEHSMSTF